MNWKKIFRREKKEESTTIFQWLDTDNVKSMKELLQNHMAKCKESYTKSDNNKLRIEYNFCQELLKKID